MVVNPSSVAGDAIGPGEGCSLCFRAYPDYVSCGFVVAVEKPLDRRLDFATIWTPHLARHGVDTGVKDDNNLSRR